MSMGTRNGHSRVLLAVLVLCCMSAGAARAANPSSQAPKSAGQLGDAAKAPAVESPYEVEYYYKAKWGYADEWLALFQKNHLPFLKALKEQGRILEIEIEKPRYHMTEDGRWDFRVTITWKNISASIDPGNEQALLKKLFPDQETFKREEQRRFEILLAHWDVPIVEVSTTL